jgi:hypothetical protein
VASRSLFTILVVLSLASSSFADPVTPGCSDSSRDCLVRAATSYLDAITQHDGSLVWLAPNVHRSVNGSVVEGEEAIRSAIDHEPVMIRYRDARFFVNEGEGWVVVFWLIDLENPGPITARIAERFKIENGRITEIEGVASRDPAE